MTQQPQGPQLNFSPQDLFDFPDPYPLFAALRQSSPVRPVRLSLQVDRRTRVVHDGVLDRLRNLRLDPEHPSRIVGLAFRSPTSLQVRFDPA